MKPNLSVEIERRSDSTPAKLLVERFLWYTTHAGTATAVTDGGRSLTYWELNQLANRIADSLLQNNVKPGSFVGLAFERSIEVIASMIAVLKVGASFVPLDSAYPDERLRFMIEDTGSRLILADQRIRERLSGFSSITAICPSDFEDRNSDAGEPPAHFLFGNPIASVMYTSGSTGKPKGVLVRQAGISRLVGPNTYCDFSPHHVFLLHSPLTFDASTFEIWGPLLNGGRLVIYPQTMPTLDGIADVIKQFQVTTLWLTAGLFHLMVDQRPEAFSGVQQLLAGGDVLSPSHVIRALSSLPENGVLINGYGPTECTTFTCCYPMRKGYRPAGTIPIGWPIAETTIQILDDRLSPVAVGEVGELFVGGAGVAAGYLNQPELTKERFIPDPMNPAVPELLYRTGDRVRELPDGALEFLGRFDDQFKIAGHRIEPGEIESALCEFPGIQQAVVLAETMPAGNKQLVAFVVSSPQCQINLDQVKADLNRRLPRYLIPGDIIILDKIPLTPNGKIDRAELLRNRSASQKAVVIDSNASDLEKRLTEMWHATLRRDVSLDQNFFDLGGTSLQLLGLHAELIKQLGRPIAVTELFEHTTIRSLAARLSQSLNCESPETPTDNRGKRQREAFQRRREGKGLER